MSGDLLVERDGAALTVTFNRPRQRNAMTAKMYDGLVAACDRADAEDGVKVLVLRGAGGEAFIAGTDISEFAGFSGTDGIAYEARVSDVLDRVESVRVPTLAVLTGYCVGAGVPLASACDVRIATDDTQIGIPVARTLGNCLSVKTYALLESRLGAARLLDMVVRARLIPAGEALAAGFLSSVCVAAELPELVGDFVRTLSSHAPLTMWATRESLRRLRNSSLPADDDILAEVYGSADFATGVASFLAKQRPTWTGR
ncbi:enoyl-CoA hydratase [Fodinicola acaciae]|uniref:enoyl-CoA hydratase n=1 Tax=Fodinicola acaciae TaxID=2681555 RepID=UPI0013D26362|nr:enoyl-CoA hydratase [Fodinicola acaciae]